MVAAKGVCSLPVGSDGVGADADRADRGFAALLAVVVLALCLMAASWIALVLSREALSVKESAVRLQLRAKREGLMARSLAEWAADPGFAGMGPVSMRNGWERSEVRSLSQNSAWIDVEVELGGRTTRARALVVRSGTTARVRRWERR